MGMTRWGRRLWPDRLATVGTMLLGTGLVWNWRVTLACLAILAFCGLVSWVVGLFCAAVSGVNGQHEAVVPGQFYRPGVTSPDRVARAELWAGEARH